MRGNIPAKDHAVATRGYYEARGLEHIYNKVMKGERLSFDDGLTLFRSPFPHAVGSLAAHVRFGRHGPRTGYVVNRQINYTNVCVNGCAFCAFQRDRDDRAGAFTLTHEEILGRIANAGHIDELHMVGGCHPSLRLSWFEELLRKIRDRYPDLPIKAFTPVEIAHFAKMEQIPTKTCLERLKAAGLQMLPGGGAEIFDPCLRTRICPRKADADQWLNISAEAHSLGLPTNCTMLFGHLETYEQRLDHLLRLRRQQDYSGGFTCFIPLPFLKENSRIELPPERKSPADSFDYLRTIAVSRLILDNIPHIKAYWIMLGEQIAQIALWYGADDLDGTITEERIGHMAGATSAQSLTEAELRAMIREAGFLPVRRNARFETVSGGAAA